jgi:hypothetical protein
MTNTKKLWKDMMDYEKGALLLAAHDGCTIEFSKLGKGDWQTWSNPMWFSSHAYRIEPKAPKVDTVTSEVQLWDDEGVNRIYYGHYGDMSKIANITHTYTITDGVVTSCDTIIHKNEE